MLSAHQNPLDSVADQAEELESVQVVVQPEYRRCEQRRLLLLHGAVTVIAGHRVTRRPSFSQPGGATETTIGWTARHRDATSALNPPHPHTPPPVHAVHHQAPTATPRSPPRAGGLDDGPAWAACAPIARSTTIHARHPPGRPQAEFTRE